MPGGDGTGPRREGPMTGRGMGYCVVALGKTAANVGRFIARGFGWGRGRGQGQGRGTGRMFRGGRNNENSNFDR
ncbi:MAG: DUF5320 domain-containing protein [Candidatus Saganbacteria bacterium]|nr:DUF5320 domain-containing protein [Candidatus Saganbacteria bacterium]